MRTAPTQLKHKRVEAEIRQLANTLPIGAKLPAERDMAITYRCNFLTVRKALKQLVNDGTIIRRVGSYFISRHGAGEESDPANGRGKRIGILVYQHSNAYAYRVLQSIAHAGLEQKVELRSAWVANFGDGALKQAELLQKDGCVALTLPLVSS